MTSSLRLTLNASLADLPNAFTPLLEAKACGETMTTLLNGVRDLLETFQPDGELKIHWPDPLDETRVDFRLRTSLGEGARRDRLDRFLGKLRDLNGVHRFEEGFVDERDSRRVHVTTFSLLETPSTDSLDWGCWWASADDEACGDLWASAVHDQATTFLVSDGVGRGKEARRASRIAADTLRTEGDDSPDRLVEVMHQNLKSTSGAVVFVGRYCPSRSSLEFCAVGDVSARRVGVNSISRLVALNGTVGYRLPELRVFEKTLSTNTSLVLHTDGLNADELRAEDLPFRTPSLNAARLLECYGGNDDDALAAVLTAG